MRMFFLSLAIGGISGVSATLLLITLQWVTGFRQAHPSIIWGLPIAGLVIGWLFHRYGQSIESGVVLIKKQINQSTAIIGARMAPLIFFGTVATHLFGGSAGREGSVIQMTAALSDQLIHWLGITAEDRQRLLMIAAGAGFAGAVGAPVAGMVFGMELARWRQFKFANGVLGFVAAGVAVATTVILKAPHSVFSSVASPIISLKNIGYMVICGAIFGISARLFIIITHWIRVWFAWIFLPVRLCIGGVLIAALMSWDGSFLYSGLGLEVIHSGLLQSSSFFYPLLKGCFTALTIGTGFKGGEFIPLVFIGTTLGSALSQVIPIALGVLAAVGFGAVFGAAANVPMACTVMICELFGYRLAPFALVGCWVAYRVSGRRGVYEE